MKMFLTRMGKNSKLIVTGDITQIDLQRRSDSGLIQIQDVLKNIQGIEFVYFDKGDVVRHRLVAEIIDAYERHATRIDALREAGKDALKGDSRKSSEQSPNNSTSTKPQETSPLVEKPLIEKTITEQMPSN
jgi:phosphate starvation-inducible PhoH-like protein